MAALVAIHKCSTKSKATIQAESSARTIHQAMNFNCQTHVHLAVGAAADGVADLLVHAARPLRTHQAPHRHNEH